MRELDAVEKLGKLFRKVPVSQWRSYLKYHFLSGAADVLPKAFDEESFDFYGRTLNGQPQQRDRWKRAVDAMDGALGEAIGRAVCRQVLPAGVEGEDGRAGREPARGLRGAHQALPG